jgi:hypothetical protein
MKRILSIVITAILAGAFAFAGLAPASASPRTGALHITKNCDGFAGEAGGSCTITTSNLAMIPPGSRVIYLEAAGSSGLDTDIVLDAGGGNIATGHVVLDFGTGIGTVRLNGGTGQFRHFHAKAAVSPLGVPEDNNWAWDGTYHFNDH